MFIQDPGSWFLSIPDPGSRIQQQHQKRRGKTFFLCRTMFCSHKYHKIVNSFIFEQVKVFFLPKHYVLFTQKCFIKLTKIWGWDPGSRVKKSPDPGSGSATLLRSSQSFRQLVVYLDVFISLPIWSVTNYGNSNKIMGRMDILPKLMCGLRSICKIVSFFRVFQESYCRECGPSRLLRFLP